MVRLTTRRAENVEVSDVAESPHVTESGLDAVRNESKRALQPSGDERFDSNRAWRTDALMLAVAAASIGAGALSLWQEYRHAGATDLLTLAALTLSLLGTAIVYCWASYVRVALVRILAGEHGPVPVRWTQPRAVRRLTRESPSGRTFTPNRAPLAWHSPLAITLWRLRLALIVLLGIFGWSIFGTGAALATNVLSWAPVAALAFGSFVVMCTCVPFILIDNARRRFRDVDIESLLEPTTREWPVRVASVILGTTLLVLSFVQLVERAVPLIEGSTRLVGQATTSVALPRSTQTIYSGCTDDMTCSPLAPSEIRVTSATTHVNLRVTDDEGVDHQSFYGHPWLSVANVRVPSSGRYLLTLGGSTSGEYRIALSQSAIFQIVIPLIGAVVWRVISLWLAGVALYETFYFRRGRRRLT